MRAVENIIQERRILEEIDHAFVCNLRYAFQDDENMFMVLDLMLGGDLRFHLERQGTMKEDVVRFYMAELALGLQYLHSKRIVHRDLKPDNVLLDEKGHAHLTDFNIAVHFSERRALTSVAGSMAYMAPEVLTKRGYFASVDWWSLGVVMYELLFGKRPFRGKTNSQLTHAILHEPLHFPQDARDVVSADCIQMLRGLCNRDVSARLGCQPDGIDDIKKHSWMRGIDWVQVENKTAMPLFEPDSKRANFDATHELEELLLEDNPLKAKKRANPNQDLSELSKEMRMMEEKFLVYDHTKMQRRSYFKDPSSIRDPANSGMLRTKSSEAVPIDQQPGGTMIPTDNNSNDALQERLADRQTNIGRSDASYRNESPTLSNYTHNAPQLYNSHVLGGSPSSHVGGSMFGHHVLTSAPYSLTPPPRQSQSNGSVGPSPGPSSRRMRAGVPMQPIDSGTNGNRVRTISESSNGGPSSGLPLTPLPLPTKSPRRTSPADARSDPRADVISLD